MSDSTPSLQPPDGQPRILGALIYVVRQGEGGDEVLMMRRNKQPNLGLWVAPGGKVERDESPYECAVRELAEETGLRALDCTLRGVVTEISPHWQWLLFIYVATAVEGTLQGDEREGVLEWLSRDALATVPIPKSDGFFGPAALDPAIPFFEATMRFDAAEELVGYTIHRGASRD